jgi:hypothetical protein
MTKKDVFNELDYEDGDQLFIVRIRKGGTMQRITLGFSFFELFGCCEMIKSDLLVSMRHETEKRVTDITRIRILDDNEDFEPNT